jgi:hypothetical protein
MDQVRVRHTYGQYAGMETAMSRYAAEALRDSGQVEILGETQATPAVEAPEDGLSALTKEDLAEIAEARGIQVTRSDGRDDLEPLKADYLHALGA